MSVEANVSRMQGPEGRGVIVIRFGDGGLPDGLRRFLEGMLGGRKDGGGVDSRRRVSSRRRKEKELYPSNGLLLSDGTKIEGNVENSVTRLRQRAHDDPLSVVSEIIRRRKKEGGRLTATDFRRLVGVIRGNTTLLVGDYGDGPTGRYSLYGLVTPKIGDALSEQLSRFPVRTFGLVDDAQRMAMLEQLLGLHNMGVNVNLVSVLEDLGFNVPDGVYDSVDWIHDQLSELNKRISDGINAMKGSRIGLPSGNGSGGGSSEGVGGEVVEGSVMLAWLGRKVPKLVNFLLFASLLLSGCAGDRPVRRRAPFTEESHVSSVDGGGSDDGDSGVGSASGGEVDTTSSGGSTAKSLVPEAYITPTPNVGEMSNPGVYRGVFVDRDQNVAYVIDDGGRQILVVDGHVVANAGVVKDGSKEAPLSLSDITGDKQGFDGAVFFPYDSINRGSGGSIEVHLVDGASNLFGYLVENGVVSREELSGGGVLKFVIVSNDSGIHLVRLDDDGNGGLTSSVVYSWDSEVGVDSPSVVFVNEEVGWVLVSNVEFGDAVGYEVRGGVLVAYDESGGPVSLLFMDDNGVGRWVDASDYVWNESAGVWESVGVVDLSSKVKEVWSELSGKEMLTIKPIEGGGKDYRIPGSYMVPKGVADKLADYDGLELVTSEISVSPEYAISINDKNGELLFGDTVIGRVVGREFVLYSGDGDEVDRVSVDKVQIEIYMDFKSVFHEDDGGYYSFEPVPKFRVVVEGDNPFVDVVKDGSAMSSWVNWFLNGEGNWVAVPDPKTVVGSYDGFMQMVNEGGSLKDYMPESLEDVDGEISMEAIRYYMPKLLEYVRAMCKGDISNEECVNGFARLSWIHDEKLVNSIREMLGFGPGQAILSVDYNRDLNPKFLVLDARRLPDGGFVAFVPINMRVNGKDVASIYPFVVSGGGTLDVLRGGFKSPEESFDRLRMRVKNNESLIFAISHFRVVDKSMWSNILNKSLPDWLIRLALRTREISLSVFNSGISEVDPSSVREGWTIFDFFARFGGSSKDAVGIKGTPQGSYDWVEFRLRNYPFGIVIF